MDLIHLFHKGMKRVIVGLVASIAALLPSVALAQVTVMGHDSSFLGVVDSNAYSNESICNQFGTYGSEFGETIFNKFGTYGGEFSPNGAYNSNAKKPPILVDANGNFVGFVTKNRKLPHRYDPDILLVEVCGR